MTSPAASPSYNVVSACGIPAFLVPGFRDGELLPRESRILWRAP